MNRSISNLLLLPIALSFVPWIVGCTRSATDEGSAVRREVDAKQVDPAQVGAEAAQKIAEQTQATREAEAKLAETESQLAETKAKLVEAEARAAAAKQRTAFVVEVETEIEAANRRVQQLKAAVPKLGGTVKDAANYKIKAIQIKRESVKKSLDKVKGAELLQWQVQRPEVQQALDESRRSMG